uniref:non-specific serine/threonine protein kinase n=1 Tax=Caenorhabditis japonica TaxID=281687 RepID=A0A8R1HPD6_CAEJA
MTEEELSEGSDKQRQNYERTALDSEFGDKIEYNKACWKVWHPIDCRFRLRPHDSCFLDGDPTGKYNKSVVLTVKCLDNYPSQSRPQIDLIEPQGISQEDVKRLLESLRKRSSELEGEVVIRELASMVTDYLTDHDSLPAGSFHDDMLANNARKETERNRKRLDTEQKELELLEEEMRQRNAMEVEKALNGTRPEGETKIIGGRRIILAPNINVVRKNANPTCHEWFGFHENMQLLISEWTFRYTAPKNQNDANKKTCGRDFGPFLRKLEDVRRKIQLLSEDKNLDNNLVRYAFVHVDKSSVQADSMLIQFFVAQEIYPLEQNLEGAYGMVGPKSPLLRLMTAQAVCALLSLHQMDHYHRHLTMGSVWMSDSNFRFSDYESMTLLTDLVKSFNDIASGKGVSSVEEKEKQVDCRKKDCFSLGTLIDTLMIANQNQGSQYARVSPEPLTAQAIEASSLTRFIKKCQEAKNVEELQKEPYLHEEPTEEDELFATPWGGSMDPNGRLITDNILIKPLGKGGFGDVVLTRNHLDQNDYAIKRIPISTENQREIRKILKEAKFFAKLNSPNTVRYYNCWVEMLVMKKESESSDDESQCAVPIPGKENGKKKVTISEMAGKDTALGGGDSLMPDNLRRLLETPRSKGSAPVEWSKSRKYSESWTDEEWDIDGEDEEEEESSSSSDDDETEETETSGANKTQGSDDVFSDDGDNSIVFLADSVPGTADEVKKKESEELMVITSHSRITESKSNPKKERLITRVLCIQMEFCDNGTLRHYIDENHCLNNPDEVWRILAEILSGLKYIHDLGIIHRDIKPLNIFLTKDKGVKIGDFGLATLDAAINLKGKVTAAVDKISSLEVALSPKIQQVNGSEVQQTREIGTQLYMAPELMEKGKPYSTKVDIYSTGVVFFEMFYRPLPPSMERVSTITNLRNCITIPEDFGAGLPPAMRELATKTVSRMLRKNSDERASADELLNDEDLPMHTKEDALLRSMFAKVVNKRDRQNAWVLDQQFNQEVPTSLNYCYDHDLCIDRMKNNHKEKLIETLRSEFCEVLKVHAFEKFSTHTLMPLSTAWAAASVRTKPTEFLDRNGFPVALPMDLRQNFVRFCVRNETARMKRYNFGRVYSQGGLNEHPHEKWECCVDSIGPPISSTSLEAELLLVSCKMIAHSLPGMKLTLKIGHALLIDAQMRHLKLSVDTRSEVLEVLHLISTTDKQLTTKEKQDLLAPKIGQKASTILPKLLTTSENNFASFKDKIIGFRRKVKVETIGRLIDKALNDLEEIIKIFKSCRTKDLENINIIYDSQTCYRPNTFGDGLVFQLQVEKMGGVNKKGKRFTVLAGGRYDSMLLRERHPRDHVYNEQLCITGFGVSMDLVALIRDNLNKSSSSKQAPQSLKILVCSLAQVNGINLISEKFKLAKQFWNMNIPADVFHMPVNDLDSLNEHRANNGISHILAVCNSALEVLCKTEFSSTKMDFDSVVSSLCRESHSLNEQNILTTPNGGPIASVSTPGESIYHDDHAHLCTPVLASRSSSTSHMPTATGNLRQATATAANLNVIFATNFDKYHRSQKDKKRAESQVYNHLSDFVQQFASKAKIEVLVCDVPPVVIKKIVGEISKTSTDNEIDALFDQLIQEHSKLDLVSLRKQLRSTVSNSNALGATTRTAIVFYCLENNFYRCLT